MPREPSPPARRGRILLWLGAFLLGLLLAGWAASEWVVRTARSRVNEKLDSRGLVLTADKESWSLLGGVTLENAVLCKKQDGGIPILEISTIHVDVEWAETLASRSAITRWTSESARLTLHDPEGAVTLTEVTTTLHVKRGQVAIQELAARRDGLDLRLTGEVLTSSGSGTPAQPLDPKLKPLRIALNTLAVEAGTGPLRMDARLRMDLRERPSRWTLDARAQGGEMTWRGLPLREAALNGRAWDGGLDLKGGFGLATGSITMSLQKEGWTPSPLVMEGQKAEPAILKPAWMAQGRSENWRSASCAEMRTCWTWPKVCPPWPGMCRKS